MYFLYQSKKVYSIKRFRIIGTQPANIGPQDVPRTSPSKVPRTSPKDTIWPFRGRPDLTSRRRPNLTSWGRSNLTFKGRPWEVLRTSPRGPCTQTWMSQKFFNFSFRTCLIDQIYLKAFQHSRCIENPVKLLRWNIFCKIS